MYGFGEEDPGLWAEPEYQPGIEPQYNYRGGGMYGRGGMARIALADRQRRRAAGSEGQVGLENNLFETLTPKQRKVLENAMAAKLKEMGVNSKVKLKNVPEVSGGNAKEAATQIQLDEQDIKDRLHKIKSLPVKTADLTLWFGSRNITSYEHGDTFGQEILDLGDIPTLEITTLNKLGVSWNNGKPAGITVLGSALDSSIREKVAKEGYILSTGFFGEPTKTAISTSNLESPANNWVFLSDSLVFCSATSIVGIVHPQEQGCYVQMVPGSPNSKKVRTLSISLHQDLIVGLVQQTHNDTRISSDDKEASASSQSGQKRLCVVVSPVSNGVPTRFQTYYLPQTAADIDQQAIIGVSVSRHPELKNHFRIGVILHCSDGNEENSGKKTTKLLLYQYVEGGLTYLGVTPVEKLFRDPSQLTGSGIDQGKRVRLVGYHQDGNNEWNLLEVKSQTTLSGDQQEPLLSTKVQEESQLLRVNLYGTPKPQELPSN